MNILYKKGSKNQLSSVNVLANLVFKIAPVLLCRDWISLAA